MERPAPRSSAVTTEPTQLVTLFSEHFSAFLDLVPSSRMFQTSANSYAALNDVQHEAPSTSTPTRVEPVGRIMPQLSLMVDDPARA